MPAPSGAKENPPKIVVHKPSIQPTNPAVVPQPIPTAANTLMSASPISVHQEPTQALTPEYTTVEIIDETLDGSNHSIEQTEEGVAQSFLSIRSNMSSLSGQATPLGSPQVSILDVSNSVDDVEFGPEESKQSGVTLDTEQSLVTTRVGPRFVAQGGLHGDFDDDDDEYVNECDCLQCNTYEVSAALATRPNRCRFFSKIMAVKSIQFGLISAWLLFQDVTLATSAGRRLDTLARQYHDLVFLAFSLFVILQIWMRVYISRSGNKPLGPTPTILMLVFTTICAGYLFGEMIARYSIHQRHLHELILTLLFVTVCMTFLPLTNIRNIDITSLGTFGSCAFATMVFSILIMFVTGILEDGRIIVDFRKLPSTWLPVIGSAEAVMMIFVLEIRLILNGRRFHVTEDDWLFAAMLL